MLRTISIFVAVMLLLAGTVLAAEQDNKAIAKRVSEEVVFQGKGVEDLMAPNFVYHPFTGGQLDLNATLQMWAGIKNAFTDPKIMWLHEIAEGDKVVLHYMMEGTQTGDFLGIPATNKKLMWTGFVIRRIENGKVAEEWDLVDVFGLMVQMGVIQPPQASAPQK